MGLTNLSQFRGAKQLQNSVELLKKSYEASKVLTSVAKTVAEGEAPANYNAEEFLKELKGKLDAISGGSEEGTSLTSLSLEVNALKDKKIRDAVRVNFNVASGAAVLPAGLDDKVPGVDKSVPLPVYTEDNEPVWDEHGAQLTLDLTTGMFSGTPSVLDIDATTDGNNIYKAGGDFAAKVFPVGEWTLSDLPSDALLDNDEIQLVAYSAALDNIVILMAKENSLVQTVRGLVGDDSVKTKIDDAIAALSDALALKADETSRAAVDNKADLLDTRVKELESGDVVISDVFSVPGTNPTLTLSNTPNGYPVAMYVNGAVYYEGDDFTVDRDSRNVVWTLTESAGGFDLTSEISPRVTVKYHADEAPFTPLSITSNADEITLTMVAPEKTFQVTIPDGYDLEVTNLTPEDTEVSYTEAKD